MTPSELLSHYGYFAVFAGTLLEGETILLLAGFAAHEGYLSLPWVMLVAFCGGTIGDQIFFFVGRHRGEALLRRFPRLEQRSLGVKKLLLRYHAALIVGVRFMYGVRIVGPIVIGMSDVPARRFLAFNLLGAGIWSVTIAGAGSLFGHSLQILFAQAEDYQALGALLLVGIPALVGVVQSWRARKK